MINNKKGTKGLFLKPSLCEELKVSQNTPILGFAFRLPALKVNSVANFKLSNQRRELTGV